MGSFRVIEAGERTPPEGQDQQCARALKRTAIRLRAASVGIVEGIALLLAPAAGTAFLKANVYSMRSQSENIPDPVRANSAQMRFRHGNIRTARNGTQEGPTRGA
jgi:hypothetical protein